MPAFHYVAIDQNGEKQKNTIEAENVKHARQLIRARGLIPIEAYTAHHKSQKTSSATSANGAQGKALQQHAVSQKELSLITRQLATLLAAGLPVEEVLAAVGEQTEKPRSKGLILSVRSKVLEGYSFANALRDFPRAFTPLYCSTVAAGEKSGHLDLVLQRLADYTDQQFSMQQKIKNALIYPSIMILVSFGIVAFLLEYVVPKMVEVYSNTGQALPLITQVLISLSTGVQRFGIYVLLIAGVGYYFFRRGMKSNAKFRERVQTYYLRLPIIGNTIKIINTARFSRTFAILSAAGVSVLEAMTIAGELVTIIPIRKAVEAATSHVREGASINLALKQTKFFPPMSIHLIASGEASGQLEPMLERAANNQDNEITQLIDTTLTLFEPAIILIMGAIVLFIVLAILLPIFQLDQMAG